MKKVLAITLVLALMFSLCGCELLDSFTNFLTDVQTKLDEMAVEGTGKPGKVSENTLKFTDDGLVIMLTPDYVQKLPEGVTKESLAKEYQDAKESGLDYTYVYTFSGIFMVDDTPYAFAADAKVDPEAENFGLIYTFPLKKEIAAKFMYELKQGGEILGGLILKHGNSEDSAYNAIDKFTIDSEKTGESNIVCKLVDTRTSK